MVFHGERVLQYHRLAILTRVISNVEYRMALVSIVGLNLASAMKANMSSANNMGKVWLSHYDLLLLLISSITSL